MGCSPCRCWKRSLFSAHVCIGADPRLHPGHQNSAVRHRLHHKEHSTYRQRGKRQGLPSVRHCSRTLRFTSQCLPPFDQGSYLLILVLHPLFILLLGNSHVYGWRTPRRDIVHRGPLHQGPYEFNIFCCSGAHNEPPHASYPHLHLQQAHILLLLGNSHMEGSDYENAIKSFERARAQVRPRMSRALFVVSLVSTLMANIGI